MTEFEFKDTMPEKFRPYVIKAHEVVSTDDFHSVCGQKQWIRLSERLRCSIYFRPSKNKEIFLVSIEGGAVDRYEVFSTAHWGEPYHRYLDEKRDNWYLRYLVLEDEFYSTMVSVMKRCYPEAEEKQLIKDVENIQNNRKLKQYEKEALAKQRIGHSSFAAKVKKRAVSRCQVNSSIVRNLIAAHIKPWASCADHEKTDISNGLCLSPNFDGLFENGAISFDESGQIMFETLTSEEISAYKLSGTEKIEISPEQQAFMAWHRAEKYMTKPS